MTKLLLGLLFFVSLNTLNACTGDCFSCHPTLVPNLKNDTRHLPMKTCINCHNPNSESMSECGPDCFECHTKEKIQRHNIKEHKVIEDCRNCHMNKLKIDITSDKFKGQSTLKSYIDNL